MVLTLKEWCASWAGGTLATPCVARVQVGYTTRNDCVLAETFLRLDHLENAVHKLKHEDMIKGIMMRLDSMQTEMAYLEEHAEEKVAESARRQQFKENVRPPSPLPDPCRLSRHVCAVLEHSSEPYT